MRVLAGKQVDALVVNQLVELGETAGQRRRRLFLFVLFVVLSTSSSSSAFSDQTHACQELF